MSPSPRSASTAARRRSAATPGAAWPAPGSQPGGGWWCARHGTSPRCPRRCSRRPSGPSPRWKRRRRCRCRSGPHRTSAWPAMVVVVDPGSSRRGSTASSGTGGGPVPQPVVVRPEHEDHVAAGDVLVGAQVGARRKLGLERLGLGQGRGRVPDRGAGQPGRWPVPATLYPHPPGRSPPWPRSRRCRRRSGPAPRRPRERRWWRAHRRWPAAWVRPAGRRRRCMTNSMNCSASFSISRIADFPSMKAGSAGSVYCRRCSGRGC